MTNPAEYPSRPSDAGVSVVDFELPPQRRRSTWLSLAMGILIFASGSICGLAIGRSTSLPEPVTTVDQIPARVADRMQRNLGLSQKQRDRMEQIGRAHQPEFRRIRAQIGPQLRRELQKIVREMAVELTPAQAAQWRADAEQRIELLVPSKDRAPSNDLAPSNDTGEHDPAER